MVTAPSATAVTNGTAIKAASRHRTRQFLRANRDRAGPGRPGCGWVVPTMPAAPAGSPGFVTDRLRTTFAPRIGKPEPAHMPG
jgi:hypothetical protein